ncbi:Golgi transport complex subunit 4 [Polyrhizophydium stewartii]|uniref:Conserved oligomeric Golgi complex subunit 4 n=1 Tax=Polyrhizophydium stewartii TaxID=2732419 RepID=A0ABR4NC51_9FUNG
MPTSLGSGIESAAAAARSSGGHATGLAERGHAAAAAVSTIQAQAPSSDHTQHVGPQHEHPLPPLPESLPLERLRSLTDIAQIREQLSLLKAEEAAVDADLDGILESHKHIDDVLGALEMLRPQVHALSIDTDGLYKVIEKTWSVAQGISDKVRQLDLEQSRVKSVVQILSDIQDLKACAVGAKQAIARNDIETGAEFIQRFLAHNVQPIQQIFDLTMLVPDGDYAGDVAELDLDTLGLLGASPIAALRSAQTTLTGMLMDAFDTAVQNADTDALVQCFKLFPLLGQTELGLDKFSAYTCGLVAKHCQDGMRAAIEGGARKSMHVDLLTRLFEAIASMVDRQAVLVEMHYGPGRMLSVMVRLQREADIQASILLGGLMEMRQLQRKVKEIEQFENMSRKKSQPPNAPPLEPPVDPRELDVILTEIASICQKAHLFDRFLRMRAADEADALRAAKDVDPAIVPPPGSDGLAKTSKLNEQVHTLIGYFVTIEDYFIRRSIEKALKIDTHDPANLTSSCVDDVFFILKTSMRRGISTSDADCLCALINSISRLLEVDFMGVLQKKLSLAFAGTVDAKDAKPGFMTTLNNIDVSCEYTIKLAQEVEAEIPRAFAHASELSREKIKSCLGSLTEHAVKFQNILRTWLENFFNQTVKPRVRPMMQGVYMDIKYVLTEDEYNQYDAADVFLKRFSSSFSRMISPYQSALTESNYTQTVHLLIDHVARDWERHVLANCKFNQLGAIRFDKDLRGFMALLSSNTQWGARDRMARLNQIATLLNVENVAEVYEYWGAKAGPINWRFNAADVRKILALRIDFSPDEIARLAL